MTNQQIAFVLARIAMGLNLFMHGFVRIPKLATFREGMMGDFEKTWLPAWSVSAFATVLPFVEFGIGLLLLIGLFTRQTLIAGTLLILVLLFGSSLQENWSAVGTQMVYVLFFFFLILYQENNALALDKRRP